MKSLFQILVFVIISRSLFAQESGSIQRLSNLKSSLILDYTGMSISGKSSSRKDTAFYPNGGVKSITEYPIQSYMLESGTLQFLVRQSILQKTVRQYDECGNLRCKVSFFYEEGNPSMYGFMGPSYRLTRTLITNVQCDIVWDEFKNRIYW